MGKAFGNVTGACIFLEDKPWKNEELKEIGGSFAKAERVRSGKSVEVVHGENKSRMRWLPPKSF